MYNLGIDIGSTATKAVLMKNSELIYDYTCPTGWNSKDTAKKIAKLMAENNAIVKENCRTVATGYGRISVPFADKIVSEITCHGLGGSYLFGNDATIIDIGGQDTKILTVKNNKVIDFLMNDKCAAGTGKFIEIMANRLGVDIDQLCDLASKGEPIKISSMCTVFAETEIINYIGQGEARENIASGIIESVITRVKVLSSRHGLKENVFLTGGLCESDYIIKSLSKSIGKEVQSSSKARYAGAIGAALLADKIAN